MPVNSGNDNVNVNGNPQQNNPVEEVGEINEVPAQNINEIVPQQPIVNEVPPVVNGGQNALRDLLGPELEDDEDFDPFNIGDANDFIKEMELPKPHPSLINNEPVEQNNNQNEINNGERQLTDDEKRRVEEDFARLEQKLKETTQDLKRLDEEEKAEREQKRQQKREAKRIEKEAEAKKSVQDLLGPELEDDEDFDPFNIGDTKDIIKTIEPPKPQPSLIKKDQPEQGDRDDEQEENEQKEANGNNLEKELTDEEIAKRDAEYDRLLETLAKHSEEMQKLDAEEEAEREERRRRREAKKPKSEKKPAKNFFDMDDNEEPQVNNRKVEQPKNNLNDILSANSELKDILGDDEGSKNLFSENEPEIDPDDPLADLKRAVKENKAKLNDVFRVDEKPEELLTEFEDPNAPYMEEEQKVDDPFAELREVVRENKGRSLVEEDEEDFLSRPITKPNTELEAHKARLERMKAEVEDIRTANPEIEKTEKKEDAPTLIDINAIEPEEKLHDPNAFSEEDLRNMQAEQKVKDEHDANVAVFIDQIRTFNNMYKLMVEPKDVAKAVGDSWRLMIKDDKESQQKGKLMLANIFKDTVKKAVALEKDASYNEHRLPEYTEIIKSTNKLVRSAMFAFTDLYHNPARASLFESTAFGGLNSTDLADLTMEKGLFNMDQRSDEAWEIQSREAKDIADEWLKDPKPYERMIKEMNSLVERGQTKGSVSKRDLALKLTAAEWLLVNNEKMMIEDPEDPINPIPNWGNRYWKAITQAREAFGISKHTSMREVLQSEYAACAKSVKSHAYNEAQIKENVMSQRARGECDSMEKQKEQFATLSASVVLKDLREPENQKAVDELTTTNFRIKISVKSENERELMKQQPKKYDFIVKDKAEINLNISNQAPKA